MNRYDPLPPPTWHDPPGDPETAMLARLGPGPALEEERVVSVVRAAPHDWRHDPFLWFAVGVITALLVTGAWR